jgi:hypothetical protein
MTAVLYYEVLLHKRIEKAKNMRHNDSWLDPTMIRKNDVVIDDDDLSSAVLLTC